MSVDRNRTELLCSVDHGDTTRNVPYFADSQKQGSVNVEDRAPVSDHGKAPAAAGAPAELLLPWGLFQ